MGITTKSTHSPYHVKFDIQKTVHRDIFL